MRNPLGPGPTRWLAIWHSPGLGLVIDWLPYAHPRHHRINIRWGRDPWMPWSMRTIHHTPIRRLGPLRIVNWPTPDQRYTRKESDA